MSRRPCIAVWLDLVMNHTDGWKQAPLTCFDGCIGGANGVYFFPDGTYAKTPWGPRPDYTKPRVVDMLLGSIEQFLVEDHGDGFRWDSVSNLRAIDGNGTTPGGKELLVAANDRAHALGAHVVAEDLKGYDAITRPTSAGGFGFDAQWDGFGYAIDDQLALASDDARDLGKIIGAMSSSYAGDSFARLLFTEDHDIVGNGGARLPNRIDAADPESFAARRRSMVGAALLFTSPGVPMIFMGQEQLATGTFANAPPPLAAPTTKGAEVRAFYRDLIALRRSLPALSQPGLDVFHRNDPAKAFAYRRHGAGASDVIVLVNLRDKAYVEYDVGVSAPGPWTVRLDLDDRTYGDDFAGTQPATITARSGLKDGQPYTLPIRLGPWSVVILTR